MCRIIIRCTPVLCRSRNNITAEIALRYVGTVRHESYTSLPLSVFSCRVSAAILLALLASIMPTPCDFPLSMQRWLDPFFMHEFLQRLRAPLFLLVHPTAQVTRFVIAAFTCFARSVFFFHLEKFGVWIGLLLFSNAIFQWLFLLVVEFELELLL